MESTLSKTLNSPTAILSLLHFRRRILATSCHAPPFTNSSSFLTRRLSHSSRTAVSLSFSAVRRLTSAVPHSRCLSHSSGGGGGGFAAGGGGGGGDGFEEGIPKAGAVDDASPSSPDAIVLDVGGMTCGGCASKVKKILENQPQVSSATVNLATETAIVWPVDEAKVVPNWRQELGELLAKHLTNCGFESNARGQGDNEGEIPEWEIQKLL